MFQRGDIIRNDYVAYYRGYPGHQSRTVVLGRPSEEQKKTYVIMRDIYGRTIEQCRVGVSASAIHLMLKRLKLSEVYPRSTTAG